MSLPSDVTPDVPSFERAEPMSANRLNAQQVGLAAAALVAFLGITYVGPAITRLTRKPPLRHRLRQQAQRTRRDLEATRRQTQKRIRQLGGRSRFWA